MTNPYTIPHLEAVAQTCRQRVRSLLDAKSTVDESLKQAKLALANAESDLVFARQLRLFDEKSVP